MFVEELYTVPSIQPRKGKTRTDFLELVMAPLNFTFFFKLLWHIKHQPDIADFRYIGTSLNNIYFGLEKK